MADRVEGAPGGAQVPRPAATMIVARPGEEGVEVLVLRRGSKSRFLPGYIVFPGGAVDPGDRELARQWFADEREASRACAVRELIEEAGLALTAEGLSDAGDNEDDMAAVSDAPPPLEALHQISHWVAPEEVPVRFDVRFFAVTAPAGLTPRPDGNEAEKVWWARPVDILADFEAGRCDLYWPTLKTMEALALCRTVEEILDLDLPQVD